MPPLRAQVCGDKGLYGTCVLLGCRASHSRSSQRIWGFQTPGFVGAWWNELERGGDTRQSVHASWFRAVTCVVGALTRVLPKRAVDCCKDDVQVRTACHDVTHTVAGAAMCMEFV